MKLSVKLFIIASITSIFTMSKANAVEVSHDLSTVSGVSGSGHENVLAETESVTIDANLGTYADAQAAAKLASDLLDGTSRDHITMVSAAYDGAPLSPETAALLHGFELRAEPGRVKRLNFAQKQIDKLLTRAEASKYLRIREAAASFRDKFKIRIMKLRFASATAAVVFAVVTTGGMPESLAGKAMMIGQASVTGILSTCFVVWSEWYREVVKKEHFFSKRIDESRWMKSLAARFQKNKVPGAEVEVPVRPGVIMDQFVTNLGLEFGFVMASTLATTLSLPTVESLSHVLTGVLNGGLGQMTFDISISVLTAAREEAIKAKFPEGPERDARLTKLKRYSDAGMTLNSIAQVWMVMAAARGNFAATAALYVYMLAGTVVRVAVLPVENRLRREAKAKERLSSETTIAPAPPSRRRAVRCEAVFG